MMVDRGKYKLLQYEVERLLRLEWNPIGFSDLPEDEYNSYALPIVSMLLQEADRNQIQSELGAALKNMGLENLKKDEKYLLRERTIIEKLLALQKNY